MEKAHSQRRPRIGKSWEEEEEVEQESEFKFCTTVGPEEGLGVNYLRAGLDAESQTPDPDHLCLKPGSHCKFLSIDSESHREKDKVG